VRTATRSGIDVTVGSELASWAHMSPLSPRTDPSAGGGLEVVGLFAGVGGLELGFSRAGHTTTALCEFDQAASTVLRAHFPGVRVHDDVRTFRLPDRIGALTAGFPCTDLSQAGRTAGITGEASGLIAGVLDAIECKRRYRRPRWLVIENVPFLLRLGRGAGIRYLTDRISDLGYRWAYRIIDTRAFGIPQRRRRVILVAGLNDDPRDVLFADEVAALGCDVDVDDKPPVGFYWTEGNTGIGWAPNAVPTLKGGSGLNIPSPPAIWLSTRIATPHIRDAERLQGFPVDWTQPASELLGTDRTRWKLVGNAVSVPVAKWIGQRLANPGEVVVDTGGARWAGGGWPDAAWGESRGSARVVWQVLASDRPLTFHLPSVGDFLEDEPADLSPRATSGFLNRLWRSRLRQRALDPFVRALRDHALTQGGSRASIPSPVLGL
jgi:DNA (cytosine-5)-methyltransferase 1